MLSRVLVCALNFSKGVYSDQFTRRRVTNPRADGDKAYWQYLFVVSLSFISHRRRCYYMVRQQSCLNAACLY